MVVWGIYVKHESLVSFWKIGWLLKEPFVLQVSCCHVSTTGRNGSFRNFGRNFGFWTAKFNCSKLVNLAPSRSSGASVLLLDAILENDVRSTDYQ